MFHFTTDYGASSVAWPLIDQGSQYGYAMNTSPWFEAPFGTPNGTLCIQNQMAAQFIQIGSVTLQFR